MTSAQQKLAIINMALGHFGQAQITQTQLDNSSKPGAVQANLFWDQCVDEILGEFNWPFATVTETLSAIDTDGGEWDYVYTYPTAAVSSLFAVYDLGTDDDKKYEQEFQVRYIPSLSNRFVHSDLQNAIAEFTYQVTDPLLWSPKFKTAMSYLLAARMVVGVNGDIKKAEELAHIYNGLIGEAKRLGSSENKNKPKVTSKYENAR